MAFIFGVFIMQPWLAYILLRIITCFAGIDLAFAQGFIHTTDGLGMNALIQSALANT
ncbi:MAG: hypothetical protein Q7J38_03785 [Gallionella sp.]|nr:hypothetical protein [Gallionella sp.]